MKPLAVARATGAAPGIIALACALLLLHAPSVLASGINLSWDECGTAGSAVKTFACNANSGSGFDLVASFMPPAGITRLLGVSAELRIASDALPDWWRHGVGECRGASGLNADFNTPPGACQDFWQGAAVGGFAYTLGGFGPNTARLLVQGAVPIDNAAPVSPAGEYYAVRLHVLPGLSTGAGACAGCASPVSIQLLGIQLFQDPSVQNDPTLTTPLHGTQVYWQAPVGAPPAILGVAPLAGAPGQTISIGGSGLTGATAVAFHTIGASYTVVSDTRIDATVPPGARSGAVHVRTPFGDFDSPVSFTTAPVVSGFLPKQAAPGTPVTITGFNLLGTSGITFNGASASFSIGHDSLVVATVPAGAGTGPLRVTNPGGTTTADSLFRVGPTVGAVDLSWGDCGAAGERHQPFACNTNSGPAFVLIGAMVPPPGVTQMVGAVANIGVYSTSGVLPDWWKFGACRPMTALTTSFDFANLHGCVDAWNGAGSGYATCAIGYYGVNSALLQVTASSPVAHPLDPATEYAAFKLLLSRTKSYLDASCAGCDQPMQLTLHQIQILQPPGMNFDPVLYVPLHDNSVVWDGNLANPAQPPPQITAFTPASGAPGSVVTITGRYFTATSSVRFAGTPAGGFIVVSDSVLAATVPPARSGPITVTTFTGSATTAAPFTVGPIVLDFQPSLGPVGTLVTIHGLNFAGASNVTFGATPATFTLLSDSVITATAPTLTPGPIGVTTPAATAYSSSTWGILPAPAILGFTPVAGPPGASVTIRGFDFTGATTVRFGGAPAAFTLAGDSVIVATVPTGAKTGLITVTTTSGTGMSPTPFGVYPTISGLSPGHGSVGTVVEIRGSNFTGATAVRFGGPLATLYSTPNDSTIDATVPPGARTGPVTVTTAAGTGASVMRFVMAPVIAGFTPGHGVPGTLVTITGSDFTGASQVTFSGVGTSFTVFSDSVVTASVPAQARTGMLAVTTAAGTGVSSVPFIPPPVVVSFDPTHGRLLSAVVVLGHNFSGAGSNTTVTLGGAGVGFIVQSDSMLTATVPLDATTGALVVMNVAGSTNAGTFTVDPGPPVPAGSINLAWNDCGSSGAEVATFSCDTDSGSSFTLVASFLPPEGIDRFLGVASEIDLASPSEALPDWWKFGSGFCRGNSALKTSFDFTTASGNCVDFDSGEAAGGFAYDVGYGAPERARLRVQYAIPFDNAGPVDPAHEYYAYKVILARKNSTGTGACAGCASPMCITLKNIQLYQPPEANLDPILTQPANNTTVCWQARLTNCDIATAVLATVLVSEVASDHVRILWHTDQLSSATIYRRIGDGTWGSLGEHVVDGVHQIAYEDPEVVPGTTYHYRLGVTDGGGERFVGETSVTIPAPSRLAISGWRWNAGEALALSLTLPGAGVVGADVFDVTGRRRATERSAFTAPGKHSLGVAGAAALPSGVYFVRVTQGKLIVTSRVVRVL